MKKKNLIIITFIMFFVGGILLTYNKNKSINIDKILETKAYSYLPQEAKNYIKEVYDETGNIILTEKNKKENVPYLNPQFVEYLTSNEDKKEEYGLLPNPEILDYVFGSSPENIDLPSSFDLRNVNGKNYITPIKNQYPLGICWAYSAVEVAESFLMYTNNKPYNENSQKFSARHLDYIFAKNGIVDYPIKTVHNLGEGSQTYIGLSIFSMGLDLFDESWKYTFNTSKDPLELNEVLDDTKSLYELDSSIDMPNFFPRKYDLTKEENINKLNEYNDLIKKYIMEYGSAIIGTDVGGIYSTYNIYDDMTIIDVDKTVQSSGHAMQLIGWDDNYNYKYCIKENGVRTKYTQDCTNAVSGTGAWIARNSWGESSSPYVYISYNSYFNGINFITKLVSRENRNWDYVYNTYFDKENIEVTQNDNEYILNPKVLNDNSIKLNKIKIYNRIQDAEFNIYISLSGKESDYQLVNTSNIKMGGIFTVDFEEKNILINDNTLIKIVSSENAILSSSNIRIFTSDNSNSTKAITDDKFYIESSDNLENGKYKIHLLSKTYNIPSNDLITYRLYDKNGNNITNDMEYVNNNVSFNLVNSTLYLPKNDEYFTIETLYNNEVKSISKLATKKYTVTYDDNTSNENTLTYDYYSQSGIVAKENEFTKEGYTFVSWNTKSDGSGTTYNVGDEITVTEDITLYAIWEPITYNVTFDANGGEGEMNPQAFTYDVSQKLSKNTFTKEGYIFAGWEIRINSEWQLLKNEEEVINLSTHNGGIVMLHAKWVSSVSYREIDIFYHANGGHGSIISDTFGASTDEEITIALRKNTYIKEGYKFKNWYLNGVGGQEYNEHDNITISNDTTLYANWEPITYTINYDRNGASESTGYSNDHVVRYDENTSLRNNVYNRNNYTFVEWNTKSDGSGTRYREGQQVKNLTEVDNDVVTLYAIWKAKSYTINFSSNGGTGTVQSIITEYDKEVTLPENEFTKEGYKFIGWSTKGNGQGEILEVGTKVVNLPSNSSNYVTLYAIWEPNKYTIEFNANGGTGSMDSILAEYDKDISLPLNSYIKDHYTFVGWSLTNNSQGNIIEDGAVLENISSTDSSIVTLYAIWKVDKYKLTYNANGGEGEMDVKEIEYNIETSIMGNGFTKEGYLFKGWNTLSNGTGTMYLPNEKIKLTEDVTLYAIWEEELKEIVNTTKDVETIYDGKTHTIEINVNVEDYTIKYSLDGTTYDIEEKPKFEDLGEYTIYYKITKQGYEELEGSNKVKIYGIEEISEEVEEKEGYLIYNKNNYERLKEKIKTNYANTIYEHLDKNGNKIEEDLLKTGDIIRIIINENLQKEYRVAIIGDVNGDGKVSALDYVKIRKHIMETERITEDIRISAADIDKNGKIEAKDYVAIRRYIMGEIEL